MRQPTRRPMMRFSGPTMSACFALTTLTVIVASTIAAAPGDEYWDGRFYTKSLSQGARCAAMGSGREIYVGGSFEAADDVVARSIARWDGAEWHPLVEGLNGSVIALIFDNSGNLYAGGNFENAGGDPDADHVAVWDGSTWSSLGGSGSGLGSSVKAFAFDSSGDLVAGGTFTDAGGDPDADRIAVWNGSVWSSIGGPGSGVGSNVEAVAFSPGGTLIIGGAFSNAGGVAAADHIAAWNGSSWAALGGGLNNWVHTLAYNDNGDLLVGGAFTDAGGDPDADKIAVWSSPTWSSVGGAGSGLSGSVAAIGITSTGRIFIGGTFTNAGGDPDADRVARWSPTSGWISMDGPGSGLNSSVEGLIIDDGNLPIVLGDFQNAGGHEDADFVARWSSGDWAALSRDSLPEGSGLNDYVYSVAFDRSGRLYAGGEFSDAGGDPAADFIAVWDHSGWMAMGPEGSLDGYVYAILENTDGDMVVGGDFQDAGGDPDADYIALWNGVTWSSMGGSGSGLGNPVHALVLTDDGRVFAGGEFYDAGGDPDGDNVAVWDGVSWSALVGPGGGIENTVMDLAVDDAGNLYAGGVFTDAGGDPDADRVAKWDGTSWTSLGGPGSGIDSNVYSLAVDDLGRVFAGGYFFDFGGNPDANCIVMWNGANWDSLGGGFNNFVRDLSIDGAGNLYAVGEFDSDYEPGHPDHIAMWDGVFWSPLGSGLDDDVYAIAYDGGYNLFVGGYFYVAGDTPSSQVGLYTGATPAGLLFVDGFESGDTSAWSGTAFP